MLRYAAHCPNGQQLAMLELSDPDPSTPHLRPATVDDCPHCHETHRFEVDLTKAPTGPFEDTDEPRPVLTLSSEQAATFREITSGYGFTVGIVDQGAGYRTVVLFDADGHIADTVFVWADGGYGKGSAERA